MSNELTVQDISNMSVAFAKSGLFGYKTSSEAFSLMMIAQAHGLHPAMATERYHIIQGRPAMKADAMLAAFQESGGKIKWVKRTDTECILHLEHPQGGELDVKWDKARATASGLWGKSNWKTYPTQMMAARCVSEGVRALYPACLSGMYTPEEVSDFGSDNQAEKTVEPKKEPKPIENVVDAEIVTNEPLFEEPKPKEKKIKATPETRKAGFVKAMEGLIKKNPVVAYKALGILGYEKPEEVPVNKIDEVYKEVKKVFEE